VGRRWAGIMASPFELELANKRYLFTELYNGGHLQSIEIWLGLFSPVIINT